MPWSFKHSSPLFARRRLLRALFAVSLFAAGCATQFPVTRTAAAEAAEPIKILAFGDSLTAGLGLSEAEAMPTQLGQALDKMGRPALVINGGVSGDTSAGGAARIDWALADKPQVMILALGANDMLRGLDPAGTRANLEAIIAKAQAANVEIILAGMMAAPNLGADYKQAFDALYPDLAKAHNLLFMPFLLQDVAMQAGLNQTDGMHPNGKGVAVMVQHLLPFVTEAMDRVEKRGAT
jgi:acyl-CoA thioesterase I